MIQELVNAKAKKAQRNIETGAQLGFFILEHLDQCPVAAPRGNTGGTRPPSSRSGQFCISSRFDDKMLARGYILAMSFCDVIL